MHARRQVENRIHFFEGAAPAFNCPYPPSCQTYNGVPRTLTPLWGVTNQPITYSPPITDPAGASSE